MMYIARLAAAAALIGITSILTTPTASFAQYAAPVTIIVNGQTASFDQPPVERAGRVFVPLRGVFERLGASAVYANGQINATGNGRNISLNIGSTQAIVDGQQQYLDVAPFLIGSRTLVPLRFVAQALGAVVDWNQSTSTVTITGGRTVYNPNPPYQNPNGTFYLTNRAPVGTVNYRNATISANFSEPVRVGSVRLFVDGYDVTNNAQVSPNGFTYAAYRNQNPGTHNVRVTGITRSGISFSRNWNFTLTRY